MEKVICGFLVDFEIDSGKSFLVLTEKGPDKHEIVGFQIEMIAKNKIPGVASLNLREKDLEASFYYDISGLISLANFFKRQKVTKVDFIKILQNITGTLTGCKKFLLNDKCFVISENLIFINPVTLEVFLIYIPCRSTADIVELFKSFVVSLVVKTANIETDDNFVQKLLGLIKEEHLCISEFNAAIKRVGGTFPFDGSTLNHQGNVGCKPDIAAIAAIPDAPKALEAPSITKGNQVARYVPAILVLLTIVAAVSIKIKNVLADVNVLSNDHVALNDPGLLWGAGAAVSVITLFAGNIYYKRIKGQSPKGRIKSDDTVEVKPITTELYINQQEMAVTAEEYGENEINSANVDETVVLCSKQQPILVGMGEEGSIVISKTDFVIGRNLNTCDYAIRNKSIGRAHARIKNNDGRYFIIDLDSKNGTFLNGDRLISNKQYDLQPNDRVAFANVQFCFKIEY